MQCDTLALHLAAEPDGALDDDLDAHLQTCLRCQADRVRYRRLRRMLASLRDQQVFAADGLFEEILDALDAQATHAPTRAGRRAACTIAAAAGAAGAAGALVLANRARSRRLAG